MVEDTGGVDQHERTWLCAAVSIEAFTATARVVFQANSISTWRVTDNCRMKAYMQLEGGGGREIDVSCMYCCKVENFRAQSVILAA